MRVRLTQVVSVLFALLLVAALATGCQQQGTDEGQQGEQQEEGPTAQGLELETVTQWAQSAHSRPVVFAAEEEGCKNCHDGLTFTETGGGFQPRIATGTAETTGTTESTSTTGEPLEEATAEKRDWVVAADCRTCHMGAGPQLAKEGRIEGVPNLDTAEGGRGALCMACHNGWHAAGAGREGNAAAPHYSVQTDMLYAVNTLQVSEGTVESTATASEQGEESPHLKVEDTCVGCHMRQGKDGAVTHVFRIEDYAGCQAEGCHNEDMTDGGTAKEDYDGDGSEETFAVEVEGLLEQLRAAITEAAGTSEFKSQGGDVVFGGGARVDVNSPEYKAAYNYFFVEKDGSRGIHNGEFTVKLLQDSLEGLGGAGGTGGTGSSTTTGSTDTTP